LNRRKPKFGIDTVANIPVEETVAMAKFADDNSLDTFWVSDEVPSYPFRDPIATMAVIASKTDRVVIGTNVFNPYTRHPALLANAILTIDEISPGRMILGLGAGGSMCLGPLGLPMWTKPRETVRDAVEAIRAMFDGNTVNYTGATFTVKGVKLFGKPSKEIPIYLGFRGPKMLQLAGRIADGILIRAQEGYLEYALENLALGAKAGGRAVEEINVVRVGQNYISYDPEKGIEVGKRALTHQVPDSPNEYLEKVGITREEANRIRAAKERGGVEEAVNYVTDRMVHSMVLVGRPEEVTEKIVSIMKKGITEFVFCPPYGDSWRESMRIAVDEVIPKVRKRLAS
jgi:5,10-methylenetetrahydromethanopterin reductase